MSTCWLCHFDPRQTKSNKTVREVFGSQTWPTTDVQYTFKWDCMIYSMSRSLYPLLVRGSRLNRQNKKLLYTMVVKPAITYAAPIWCSILVTTMSIGTQIYAPHLQFWQTYLPQRSLRTLQRHNTTSGLRPRNLPEILCHQIGR